MSRSKKLPGGLDAALAALIKRIDDGQEFPDASAAVATAYGVDIGALTAAYDDHCGA